MDSFRWLHQFFNVIDFFREWVRGDVRVAIPHHIYFHAQSLPISLLLPLHLLDELKRKRLDADPFFGNQKNEDDADQQTTASGHHRKLTAVFCCRGVTHDQKKQFLVKTSTVTVQVLGTSCVSCVTLGYEDTKVL